MKVRLAKLINVKTIVTILLTLTFVILSLMQVIPVENFCNIFSIVIAFYFGTQTMRDKNKDNIDKIDTSD